MKIPLERKNPPYPNNALKSMNDIEPPNLLTLSHQGALGDNKHVKKLEEYHESLDHLTRKNSLSNIRLDLREDGAKR